MITLIPFTLLVLLLLVYASVLLAKARDTRVAYLCLFWIPPALLSLMYVFRGSLERALSYGVIVLLLLVVIVSIVLGLTGVILVLRYYRRGEIRIDLITATVLASLPAAIFAVDLAWGR